jgi:NTP pyrophosphatase (non-canonical NTP hydrolase)
MLIDDYATWAAKVTPARLGAAAATEERRLLYLVLALAGEAGELADHVKNTTIEARIASQASSRAI